MTGIELTKAINRLREITPQLNEITDHHTKVILATEESLAEIGIGLRAMVEIESHGEVFEEEYQPDDQERVRQRVTELAYRRHAGTYRVCVVVEVGDDPLHQHGWAGATHEWIEVSCTPWEECSRETRLRAFPFLPKLIQEISKEAERLMVVVEDAEGQIAERGKALVQRNPLLKDVPIERVREVAKCGHEWVAFNTMYREDYNFSFSSVLVECASCHVIGRVEDFTTEEWATASGRALGEPYRWQGDGEVIDFMMWKGEDHFIETVKGGGYRPSDMWADRQQYRVDDRPPMVYPATN